MMPSDWKARLEGADAIFFGACGWPATVPDHVSLWGSLIKFRREFDQYVNLRPCKLMPGIRSPLVDRNGTPWPPEAIDFVVVRENTEGEYSSIGGRMFEGTEREFVVQETVMTRHGVDRVLRFAFDLAGKRPKKHLTSATKSNGISITMPYWDERVEQMAKQYPTVRFDKFHIDILTAHFVRNPDWFDVVVGVQSVRRHPVGPWAGVYRHDRHRPIGQLEPGPFGAVAVRAGARFGPRHRGAGNCKPDRADLERVDDARLAGTPGGGRRGAGSGRVNAGGGPEACSTDTRHRRHGRNRRSRQGDRGSDLTR